MVKVALLILVVASVIGALMPSKPGPPENRTPVSTLTIAGSGIGAASEDKPQVDDGSGVIRLERQDDGHFYLEAKVNGVPVNFLVDTGASMIALTVADAQKSAVPVETNNFRVIARGASGDVRGAPVEIGEFTVAGQSASGVPAVIIDGGEQSLLGQSFLSTFDTVEIRGDEMMIY